jgi:DNA-binding NarL/FixJ family response regulator
VRVVIGEDSVLLREGIARLLMDAGVDVRGAAGDLDSIKELTQRERPDVLIVDIRMPPTHTDEGIQLARWARATFGHEVGVLVLSQHIDPAFALDLVTEAEGGLGYLLKERIADVEDFVDAVRRVGKGGSIVDPSVVRAVVRRDGVEHGIADLTPREREVLELMAEGRSNAAIGAQLSMTVKTLESHISTILSKLQLEPTPDDNRRVLAVLAYLRNAG